MTKTLHGPKAKNLDIDSVLIRSIEVVGTSDRENRWLIRKGHLTPGKYYLREGIEKAVKVYRGTGAFDEITYTVKESDPESAQNSGLLSEMYDLSINMKPSPPHVFGVGLHYDTDEGTSLLFNLGINEKHFGGSKLSASAKLSYSPRINFTYTYSRSSLANFNLAFDYKDDHYKLWATNSRSVNQRYFQRKLTASISQFHLLDVSTSVGISYQMTGHDNTSMEDNYLDSMLYVTTRHFIPFVEVVYDNLDDAYFANHGMYARFASHYYIDPHDRINNVFDLCYAFKYYYSIGDSDFTVIPQLYGRYSQLTLCPYQFNYYGGEVFGRHFDEQLPFVGSDPLTITGDNAAVVRCDLRYHFLRNHYLTGIYNIRLNLGFMQDYTNGVGLKYSYNSIIGPVSLTAQWNQNNNRVSGYLSIGYYF